MKMLLKNKTLVPIFVVGFIILSFVTAGEANACTYEEVLNSDWGNYLISKVEEILSEDISVESLLAPNQKESMLIGDMRNFYSDFDKVSEGIKYEALCAISALETGHFSSSLCREFNNVGGLTTSSGYAHYPTKEDGIQAMADLLSNEYLSEDGRYFEGKTILDVSKHYNQSVHFVNLYVKIRIDMENRIKGITPIYPEEECCLCEKIHSGLCKLHDFNPMEVNLWTF